MPEKPVTLPYGQTALTLPTEILENARLVLPGPFPDEDGKDLVAMALENPCGGMALEDLLASGDRFTCVIPDLTRRAAVATYLPILLQRCLEHGLDPDRINILIALGIHRPMTDAEIRRHVGDWVCDRFRVENHDCDNPEMSVPVGTTDSGIRVKVDRRVADADGLLITGSVTYHYFAGYGGGRKSILPGVCARETCEQHHKLVVKWRRGEIDGHLGAGLLEGNPVEAEMASAATMVPPAFCLNVATAPDGRIVGAAAGDLREAHLAVCRLHDRCYRKPLKGRSGLVIASAGGWPRDINFVQSHKGYLSAVHAAEPGGVVIMAAACQDGPGHRDFLSWFRRCGEEAAWLEELDNNYQINGQTAYSTWLASRGLTTVLISEMPSDDVRAMGMVPAPSMEDALAVAQGTLGFLPPAVVMPNAADVLVEVD